MYEEISKGIKLNTPYWKLQENIERNEKENKRFLENKELWILELIANGLSHDVAWELGTTYYNRIVKTIRTLNSARQNGILNTDITEQMLKNVKVEDSLKNVKEMKSRKQRVALGTKKVNSNFSYK